MFKKRLSLWMAIVGAQAHAAVGAPPIDSSAGGGVSPLSSEELRRRELQPKAVTPKGVVHMGTPTFTWADVNTKVEYYSINLFHGDPENDPDSPDPVIFERIVGQSFTLPDKHRLTVGHYTWEVVGLADRYFDFTTTGWHRFTVTCRADLTSVGGSPAEPDLQVTVDDLIAFVKSFAQSHNEGSAIRPADLAGGGARGDEPDGELTVDDAIAFVTDFTSACESP